MFGLGMGEILVIAIVALLFLGPEKLPDAAKTLSKGIRDLRRTTKELQRTIEDDTQVGDAIRDIKSALRGDSMDPYKPPAEGSDGGGKDGADAYGPKTHKASAKQSDDATGATPESADPESEPVPAPEPAPAPEASAEPPRYTYGNDNDGEPLIRPAAGTVAKGEPLEPTPAADPAEPPPADDKAHG